MYLNYQIIRMLENCFQNISCFQFWSISNIDTTTTHLLSFPASLAIFVEFLPDQLKPLFNAIIIMFFIGFPIFSYLIRPHAAIIGYTNTAQKMKFSIKDFFSKCDQIRSFLWIWSHLQKKALMENFIYWAVQTICQDMLIKFVIKVYANHNSLLVKPATYQKAESLRGASLSKLDNMVNNSSIFNTKCPEFSTKW